MSSLLIGFSEDDTLTNLLYTCKGIYKEIQRDSTVRPLMDESTG